MALKRIKPALDQLTLSDKIWDRISTIMEHVRLQFYELSDSIKKYENTSRIPFPLFRYLSKVVSATKDIKALMKAANSPSLRKLLYRDFQTINLEGSGNIP